MEVVVKKAKPSKHCSGIPPTANTNTTSSIHTRDVLSNLRADLKVLARISDRSHLTSSQADSGLKVERRVRSLLIVPEDVEGLNKSI